MATNNGKDGGLLKGKPHYDKNGKSLGGIKAIVTDTKQMVELEGGEVIINKEASKKHWKELSRINQSAGNGVPILPPDKATADTEEYKYGGRTIDFNPNVIPNKWVYEYAKTIKEKYPKVWALGGNEFGNEAFKNLERALKRGQWTENEEWMFVKWQSFNARHKGDFRIAGVIANLKWLNKVDKGWDYMKALIEKEIEKKYGEKPTGWKHKMKTGGDVIGKYTTDKNVSSKNKLTKSDVEKIKPEQYYKYEYFSKTNEKWQDVKQTDRPASLLKNGYDVRLKEIYRYVMKTGGELAKGIKSEQEHIGTATKLYNQKITPKEAPKSIAKEHLKEDKKYYTKLDKMESKFATGGNIKLYDAFKHAKDVNQPIFRVGLISLASGRLKIEWIANKQVNSVLYFDTEVEYYIKSGTWIKVNATFEVDDNGELIVKSDDVAVKNAPKTSKTPAPKKDINYSDALNKWVSLNFKNVSEKNKESVINEVITDFALSIESTEKADAEKVKSLLKNN